jgi:hypothetical protein
MKTEINIGLQEWANRQHPDEVTVHNIIEAVESLMRHHKFLSLIEAQEINPAYKQYGEPQIVGTIQVQHQGADWIETYTVLIDGIWLGNGADIDFYSINVT